MCENIHEVQKTESVYWGISRHFFRVLHLALRILQHFAPGLAFAQKVKGFLKWYMKFEWNAKSV